MPKTKKRLPSKKCKGCGTYFVPKSHRQKYHTPECREAYYLDKFFAKVAVTKTCPNCGTVFTTTCPSKQVYCLPKCRQENAEKRRLGATSEEQQALMQFRYAILERDNFECVLCGAGKKEHSAVSVVEDRELGIVTLCASCKAGRGIS